MTGYGMPAGRRHQALIRLCRPVRPRRPWPCTITSRWGWQRWPAWWRQQQAGAATTTGTRPAPRLSLVRNTVLGRAVARAWGCRPVVGLLNLTMPSPPCGQQLRRIVTDALSSFRRGESAALLRGNDLLAGSDVVVCDTLTGNLLKMLGPTGRRCETQGSGYGRAWGRITSA